MCIYHELVAAAATMLHPLLETVSNFVWRIAVPRPWPAEHVRPERSDAAVDRGRISRNNARANLMLAVQSIIVTPFTCVYVSAATHLGRQPGVFPFRGNFRALRAIAAAEGVRGLFKVGATWASRRPSLSIRPSGQLLISRACCDCRAHFHSCGHTCFSAMCGLCGYVSLGCDLACQECKVHSRARCVCMPARYAA